VHQVAKDIGAYSAALKGKLDAILITGGIAFNTGLMDSIKEYVEWIAPVKVYPGEDEMEGLKAFDRSLFGGSPDEVPDRYADSSPITYVDQVRAPVLVLAGENDPRCPIRQIENYLDRLAARDVPHEVYRYDAGHGSLVNDERVRQMRVELDFAARHLPQG